jgi:UDP-3-O-[3-hydroxymyristoyl] N-acetylglucosamine deacetylase
MQTTIAKAVEIEGIGLHTGFQSRMRLVPAPPNSGIVFRRSDLHHFPIPAIRQHVSKVSYATSLMKQGVLIATVEHVLSAIAGLNIDNLYVDVNTMEIPIIDGSACPFVKLLDQAGLHSQSAPRQVLRLLKPIRIESEDKWIEAGPCNSQQIHYHIFFDHPLIQHQEFYFEHSPAAYRKEIASARTFGIYEELDMLIKAGLIRGGSLDNAVVLNKDGLMNSELRFPDEFVRHKILDLVGDIALVGKPLQARIRAYRAGHALHYSLANQILKHPESYEIICEDNLDTVAEPLISAESIPISRSSEAGLIP